MISSEIKDIKRLIAHVRKASEIADRLELLMGAGAEAIASNLGRIADDLEITLRTVEENRKR